MDLNLELLKACPWKPTWRVFAMASPSRSKEILFHCFRRLLLLQWSDQ